MDNHPYTLWSLWPQLSLLYRLFVLILAVVSIHTLFSATIIMKRLHDFSNPRKEISGSIQANLVPLHNRCANLRQILAATFYLFGFLFFIGLQRAPITLGDGPTFPMMEVLGSFVFHFVFAANIFLVFLVLHLVQWIVSSRVKYFRKKKDL
jgi:hypothetical protein